MQLNSNKFIKIRKILEKYLQIRKFISFKIEMKINTNLSFVKKLKNLPF